MPVNQLNQRPARRDVLMSIVLPVFNEQAVLAELSDAVVRAAAACGVRYEIIFVDDGSNDGSGATLDRLAAESPNIGVLHLSRNFGHQAAVEAGLEHASGDVVVLMDSDMQDAPDALPRFLDQWYAGYDVVYAVRTERKEGLLKKLAFRGFYRLLNCVSSTPIPLDAGNFGLIDRRVAQQIVTLSERDRYYPGLRRWVGFNQIGVEVERMARYDGQPRVSIWGLFRLAKTAIFSFSSLPLSIFYLIGIVAAAIFIGLSSYSLFCKLFTSLAIPGWTSHVLIGCFFGALNALGVSILGEYVIRIYDQVRGRPLFVVDRSVNVRANRDDARSSIAEPEIIFDASLIAGIWPTNEELDSFWSWPQEVEQNSTTDDYDELLTEVHRAIDTLAELVDAVNSVDERSNTTLIAENAATLSVID